MKPKTLIFAAAVLTLATNTVATSYYNGSNGLTAYLGNSTGPSIDFFGNTDGTWNGNVNRNNNGVWKPQGLWDQNQSLSFDGSGDYVATKDYDTYGDGFAVSTWAKFTDLSSNNGLAVDAQEMHFWHHTSQNAIRLEFRDSGDGAWKCDARIPESAINTNEWDMFTATFNGTHCQVYMNKTLMDTVAVNINTFKENTNPLLWGERSDCCSAGFTGDMDGFRIYDNTLSKDQITNRYISNSIDNSTIGKGFNTSLSCTGINTQLANLSCSWNGLKNNTYTELYVEGNLVKNTSGNTADIGRLWPNHSYTVEARFHNSTNSTSETIGSSTEGWTFDDKPDLNMSEAGPNVGAVKDSVILTDGQENVEIVDGSGWIATTINQSGDWHTGIWKSQTDALENWIFVELVPGTGGPIGSGGYNAPEFVYNENDGKYYLVTQDQDGYDAWIEAADHPENFDYSQRTMLFDKSEESSIGKAIDFDLYWNGTNWLMAYGSDCGIDEYGWAVAGSINGSYTEKNVINPTPTSFCEGSQLISGFSFSDGFFNYHVSQGNPNDRIGIFSYTNTSSLNNPSSFVTDYLGTADSGWDSEGRGHGDIAWYKNSMVLSYQGFDSGDTWNYGAHSTVLTSKDLEATDNAAPSITVHNPSNTTYNSPDVDLKVTANESSSWKYSLDGAANQSFTPNTTLSGLSAGQHDVVVWATDDSGNANSEQVYFSIEEGPLASCGLGPENCSGDLDVLYSDTNDNLKWRDSSGNTWDTGVQAFRVGGVADFDDDEDLDVLYRNNSDDLKWVDAAGNVQDTGAQVNNVGGVADFDNDRDLDVFYTDSNNNLKWRDSSGNVQDTGAQSLSVGGIADFDNDGDLDVLYADSNNNLKWRDSSGNVQDTGVQAFRVGGVADFDNNGDADVLYLDVSYSVGGYNLKWVNSTGDVQDTGAQSVSVGGVADFDNDTDIDVLYRDSNYDLKWQDAAGNIQDTGAQSLSVGGIADFDNDTNSNSGQNIDISVHSPANTTYSSPDIPLKVTANTSASWQYSLDGASNISFTPNTTLSGLSTGQHNVVVWAKGSSGDVDSEQVYFSVEDTTAPSISFHADATSAGTYSQSWIYGKYSASDDFSLNQVLSELSTNQTASDLGGGTYEYNHTGLSDGTYSLRGWAEDGSGNWVGTNTRSITVDTTPPSSSDNWTVTGYQSQDSALIEITASDTTTSVSELSYRVDGGPWNTVAGSSTTVTVSGDGNHTVEYNATDSAGNTESVQTEYVALDTAPPSTTDDYTSSGWQNTSITVGLSCTDSDSGCSTTNYRVNNGVWNTGKVFSVSTQGNNTIEYNSTDSAGNMESMNTDHVAVDTVAPSITVHNPGNTTYGSSSVDLKVTGEDTTSGIATWKYSLDSGSWTTFTPNTTLSGLSDGQHDVQVKAVDNAGNVKTSSSMQFTVDTTAPTTTDNASSGWHTSSVTVGLSCSDSTSSCSETSYRVDGGAWLTGTKFTVSSDGNHTVEYNSTDSAGNTESVQTTFVAVDTTNPSSSDNYTSSGWQAKSQTAVKVTVSDGDSGVSQLSYRVDGGSWTTVSGSSAEFNVSGDGNHTVEYNATDTAGNTEPVQTEYVALDDANPSVSVVDPANTTYSKSTLDLKVTGSDSVSSVQTYEYSKDGGTWTTFTPNTTLTWTNGFHDIRVRVTDSAGNTATDQNYFTVDTTPPTTSDNASTGWHTSPVTVGLTCSDSTTGCSKTSYNVNSGGWLTGTEFQVSTEGNNTVEYNSTDTAGNMESTNTIHVAVDTVDPASSDNYTATGWQSKAQTTVSVSVSDSSSGVSKLSYRVDGGPWTTVNGASAEFNVSGDGNHTVEYNATDDAGNSEPVQTEYVALDNTGPSISYNSNATASSSDYGKTWILNSIIASDATSGLQIVEESFEQTNSSFTTASGSLYEENHTGLSEDITYEFYGYAKDQAGNTVMLSERSVTVNTSADDTAFAGLTIRSPTNSSYSSTTLDLNVTALETVDTWKYSINGTANQTFTPNTSITVLGDGQHNVTVWANDTSGNYGSSSVSFNVDTTPPTASLVAPANTTYDSSDVPLNVTGTDVSTWTYSLDGQVNQSFTPNTTLTGLNDSQHNVTVWAEDEAGNTVRAGQEYFYVNASSGSNSGPSASFSTSTSDLTVSVDASGSSDSDGNVTKYEWDWTSDGTYDATGKTASHSFGSGGDYTVTLRVTDNSGATNTTTKTVSVSESSDGGGSSGGSSGGGGSTGGTDSTDDSNDTSNTTGTGYSWKASAKGKQLKVYSAGEEFQYEFKLVNDGGETVELKTTCKSENNVCNWVQSLPVQVTLQSGDSKVVILRGRIPENMTVPVTQSFQGETYPFEVVATEVDNVSSSKSVGYAVRLNPAMDQFSQITGATRVNLTGQGQDLPIPNILIALMVAVFTGLIFFIGEYAAGQKYPKARYGLSFVVFFFVLLLI